MRSIFFLLLFLAILFPERSFSTHLMGGSMTYEYTGSSGGNDNYHVTLKIYRYCDTSGGGTAPLDNSMSLGIYNQDLLSPNDDKNWFTTETLILTSSNFIEPPSVGPTCNFTTTVCVQEGIFEADISLPPDPGGYHLMVERCCRNGNIANLSTPGSVGQTYYCFIPPAGIINSSPQFSDIPVPYMCTNDTISIVNNAFDPDGDSLVYSFEIPYGGYSSSVNPIPDPFIDNNPYIWPIAPVLYNPGYSMPSPFGAGGYAGINTTTGLTEYFIPNQGFYVVAIEIKEYRNGTLISSVRRDLQLIAIVCPPNDPPLLSSNNGSGTLNYTITEGQTLCFPVIFTDPNGDSLYIASSGTIFNSAIVNPPASISSVPDDNISVAQFCWSTDCGQASPAPYQFTVSGTDNGCPPKTTNIIYSITVNPFVGTPAPDVTIDQDPPNPICTGTSVTFTAIPTFGGTSPSYQWQLNGVNVGGNSNTYVSNTLNNGDVVTVTLTSNSTCVTTTDATSPPIVVNVNPTPAPEVSISASPAGPLCAGANVTFTALPINPGASPVYQWTVNGNNVGGNSNTYTTTGLATGDQVAVSLTASAACPAANSNVINVDVSPVVSPSVTITSTYSGAICAGEQVTFNAWPTAGGIMPTYQWQINGVNVGVSSNTFSSTTLNDGDAVSVILTSSEICVTSPTANSNIITINVTPPSAPSVSITVSPAGPICKDDNVIFTATPTLGGSNPTYQWQVNGINTGPNSPTFATALLNNGDMVRVRLTSSLSCAAPVNALSNVITMTVNPILTGSVSISANPAGAICPGQSVTFTATPLNGGTSPSYQWQVNGTNVGANNSSFTTSNLNNLDNVRVIATSNGVCVSPLTSISNVLNISVLSNAVPSVSITSVPGFPICDGTQVTFTATPVLGGPTPDYEWRINGATVGINSPNFVTNSLMNGDVVRVRMTSSANCPLPATVSSTAIIAIITPTAIPSVNIAAVPSGPICTGTNVTFTATPVNGGPLPIYQWFVNGTPSGVGTTFSSSTLSDGDMVIVRLTSNANCANPVNVLSNDVVMVVNPFVTPQVWMTADPPPYCDGDSINFTTNTTFAGISPTFEWFVNGTAAGTNNNTYKNLFSDGDLVYVVLTSSEICLTTPTDTSNKINLTINPNLTPGVSITSNPQGPYCPGDLITFNSSSTNGGNAPVYQWTVNGTIVGGNSPNFSSSALSNGDLVRVRLTSSEQCVTNPNALSNIVNVQISSNVTPQVTISVIPNTSVCDGDSLNFSTQIQAGGTAPIVEWFVNGAATGVLSTAFSANTFSNGDVISAILTSSAFCAVPLTDTSNQITAIIDPLLSPSVSISANPPGVFCDGTEITYSASISNGGLTPNHEWLLNGSLIGTNNDTLISSMFLDGDTLSMTLTSSEECLLFNPATSNILIIDRYPKLQPEINSIPEICEGESFTLNGIASGGNGGPYYYSWNNGLPPIPSHVITPDSTDTYILTVSDSCSTPRTIAATVIVNPLPIPVFAVTPPNATILNPFFEFTDQSTHAFFWTWDFGDGQLSFEENPSHTYLEPGLYNVGLVVTSDKGCIDSTRTLVNVENVVIYYMPNSFTPNNDGTNDQFGPVGYSVDAYNLIIYNRWGQQVYQSQSGLGKWDGQTPNGSPAPQGVYIYHLQVLNDPDGGTKTGTVTLVR